MAFCTKCGNCLPEESLFCNKCGARVVEPVNEKSDAESSASCELMKDKNDTLIKEKLSLLEETKRKRTRLIYIIGGGALLGGLAIFLLIALISLIGWGKIFFYNGYTFTKVFCTISLILMIVGLIAVGIYLIIFARKNEKFNKRSWVLTLIAIGLAVAFSIVLIVSAAKSSRKSSYSTSSSYSASSGMSHSVYCMLYMKVSDVKVTHSHGWAYITGRVTNNGTYQIKYVKVKAICKSSYGSIVDTDWTYAVDGTWLDPGESKTFEMMVKDDNYSISKADVEVIAD